MGRIRCLVLVLVLVRLLVAFLVPAHCGLQLFTLHNYGDLDSIDGAFSSVPVF